MQPQTPIERRSTRSDRRRSGPPAAPPAADRRRGDRRQLPRSRWRQWPSLLASAALGVVTAVLLQSAGDAAPTSVSAATRRLDADTTGRILPVSPTPVDAGGISARDAALLRDEAGRLTPAAVALDEQAQTLWWPRRAAIDAAVADPATPAAVREDLRAVQYALERVGL